MKTVTHFRRALAGSPMKLAQRAVRRALALYHAYTYPLRYSALADKNNLIFVKASDIAYIWQDKEWSRWFPPGTIVSGYPDLETYAAYCERVPKDQSILLHFHQGIPWQETPIFCQYYRARFQHESKIRGCRDMDELYEYYRSRYDPLFEIIRNKGIDHEHYGKGIEPLYVHISMHGEFIWTSNGQHRLAMCVALGIEPIPCLVYARHREWQLKRDALKRDLEANRPVEEALLRHPDMQDIVLAARGAGLDRRGDDPREAVTASRDRTRMPPDPRPARLSQDQSAA